MSHAWIINTRTLISFRWAGLTMDGTAVDGATLTQDPMCGTEAGEHGHED